MSIRTGWRTWGPPSAFLVFAGGWYFANVAAEAAQIRTMRSADAKYVAAGHPAPFSNWTWPSAWSWGNQADVRSGVLGLLGAALIAVLLRRARTAPWFALAAACPIVLGHSYRIHEWWAAGPGIDRWTFGAGVGTRGLDLTHYGAGPHWTLVAGTLLAIAAVVLPALMIDPPAERAARAHFVRGLPYVVLIAAVVGVLVGALHIDNSGDGSSNEMLIAAAVTLLLAGAAAFVVMERGFVRTTAVMAVASGLVMVAGLNPSAMASTKWAAFAAAAGIAIAGSTAARRPRLRLGVAHKVGPAANA